MDIAAPLSLIAERLEGWIQGFIALLPNLAVALLLLVMGWIVARFVRRGVERTMTRRTGNAELAHLTGLMVGALVVLGVGFVALGILQLDKTVTTLLAGVGVLGLALGFAFQDTVENLISGVALAINQPFSEGEAIKVADDVALVEQIGLRSTVLQHVDGPLMFLPNSQIFQNKILNFSRARGRRIEIEFGVSYADDLNHARELALGAVQDVQGVDPEEETECYWREFGGSSINGSLRFWLSPEATGRLVHARSEVIVNLKNTFDQAGISMPFPVRTLDFGVEGGLGLTQVAAQAGWTTGTDKPASADAPTQDRPGGGRDAA